MDPLSITTSAIALIGFCHKLSQGLVILKQLSHIPDDIAAILDELQDFKNVLSAVCVVARRRTDLEGLEDFSESLKTLLLKSCGIITSIANHCGIAVERNCSGDFDEVTSLDEPPVNLDLLSRFRWLKDKKKIEAYRRQLKLVRLDIANLLASLSL